MHYGINPDLLYDAKKEAPDLLHTSPHSLKRGRIDGKLFGYPSPPFIKMGSAANSRVLYTGQALIEFLNQFQEQATTTPNQLPAAGGSSS